MKEFGLDFVFFIFFGYYFREFFGILKFFKLLGFRSDGLLLGRLKLIDLFLVLFLLNKFGICCFIWWFGELEGFFSEFWFYLFFGFLGFCLFLVFSSDLNLLKFLSWRDCFFFIFLFVWNVLEIIFLLFEIKEKFLLLLDFFWEVFVKLWFDVFDFVEIWL